MEHYTDKQKIFLLGGVRYLIILTFILFFLFSRLLFHLPLTGRFLDLLIFAGIILFYNTIGILLIKKIPVIFLCPVLIFFDLATCFIFWGMRIFDVPGSLDFLFFIFSGFPALAAILGPRASIISFAAFLLSGFIFFERRGSFNFGSAFFLLWQSFFFSFIIFFIGYATGLEKKAREEILKLNEKLEIANKYKNQFLAIVSHEFKTPINSIMGFSRCIIDGLDGPVNSEQKTSLKKVLHSSETLLQLVNDLLDLSKIEAGKLNLEYKEFYLDECIGDVITALEPLYTAKGLKVANNSPHNAIYSDYSRLRQILINLISNSIKFTHQGVITISVSPREKNIEISVSDEGQGIPEELLPRLFDEYSSLSKQYGGTGLGLSITRKLVEILGGRIWVESQVDSGSKFTFTLPSGERKQEDE